MRLSACIAGVFLLTVGQTAVAQLTFHALSAHLASAWPQASSSLLDADEDGHQGESEAVVGTVVFGRWPVGSADFDLEVDGESQGHLDNDDDDDSLEMDPLDPGPHRFKLSDITL